VPENWYQNLAPVFGTGRKISGTSNKTKNEIAAVCAIALIVYYIITNNLNELSDLE